MWPSRLKCPVRDYAGFAAVSHFLGPAAPHRTALYCVPGWGRIIPGREIRSHWSHPVSDRTCRGGAGAGGGGRGGEPRFSETCSALWSGVRFVDYLYSCSSPYRPEMMKLGLKKRTSSTIRTSLMWDLGPGRERPGGGRGRPGRRPGAARFSAD